MNLDDLLTNELLDQEKRRFVTNDTLLLNKKSDKIKEREVLDLELINERLYVKYPFTRYLYEVVKILEKGKVIVNTPYGECKISRSDLLRGHAPSIRSAINKESFLVEKVLYKYNEVIRCKKYNNVNNTLIQQYCDIHGWIDRKYTDLIQTNGRCPKCSYNRNKVYSYEEYIEKVKNKHSNFFTYIKSDYKGVHSNLRIVCPYHGEFKQKAYKHLQGDWGCKVCTELYKRYKWYNTKKKKSLKKEELTQLKNLPCKLYVIYIYNKEEEFLKIGITKNSLKRRYDSLKFYKYETLKIINSNLYNCVTLESLIINSLKDYKYIPLSKIDGYSECLKIGSFFKIIKLIKNEL